MVYKYLTTDQPKYFAPYLPLYKSAMNTRCSNPKNLFLQVPSYCASIHKSKVHFNNSFSYDAPKLWNDLPYDIRSGAKDRHKWLSDSFHVNILGNCLSPADVVRNLGVLFDAKFCFTNHVNSVIKSCFISLRDLHCIRRFLSVDTSVVIANALVSSRLDYCNSLFRSLSS